MRSLIKGLSSAALFVGAVVGAGFATGQEIRLFFGEDGILNLLVASLFMAICAFCFLELGAGDRRWDPRVKLAAESVVTLASFAVYAAMIAAAEEVLFELTGRRGISILLAVSLLFVMGKRIGWVSRLNLLAVPLMAGIIVAVGLRSGGMTVGEEPHVLRSCAYGGMNLLFSGALMMEEGRVLTRGERVIASVAAGGTIFLLLFFMYRSIGGTAAESMPFLAAAKEAGMGILAPLALLLAIVTTMASCGYLVTDRLIAPIGDTTFVAPAVVLCGILASQTGFSFLVSATYPIISCLGLAASFFALLFGARSLSPFKNLKNNANRCTIKK